MTANGVVGWLGDWDDGERKEQEATCLFQLLSMAIQCFILCILHNSLTFVFIFNIHIGGIKRNNIVNVMAAIAKLTGFVYM